MKVLSTNLFLFTLFADVATGTLIPPARAYAQQTQASLTGQVLDQSGAAVQGAAVTITNVDTAITRMTQTTPAGRYTVTNLNPGNYTVAVKAPGFKESISKGVVLAVGTDTSLDLALVLGEASDVVTVTADAAVTDTETSSQGTVIDNQEVVGLPLNQRTFYGLALLSPAAYMPGQSSTLGFRGGFNVAGNNETANTFTVNGIDDNDQNVMAPSFRPSVEAIQEFKLLTGVYSAEYGRTSGGQVVVITKTGTNQVHGDLFEFIRNSQFDAKNYFTLPNTPTTFRRNQFGGTIGGPILKDRTFFFLSYEGLRLAQPVVATTNVPNPAFQTGNFSSLCTSYNAAGLCMNGTTSTGTQLKDPLTGAAFAFNQIPQGRLSPLGVALLRLYPLPNPGYLTTTPNPAYTFNEKRTENLDEGSARIDHKISEKDSLLLQYNYFNDPSFEPSNSLCGSAVIPGFGCTTNQISTLAGINYTHIINEHLLNEFRIGYDRLEQPRTGQDVNNGFTKIPGAFTDNTISSTINGGAPVTAVSGFATLHPYTNLPQHRWDNHYNLVDNLNWSRGKHNLKFGVNLLQARYSDVYVAYGTGSFTFNTSQADTTGYSAADLATGYAYQSTRSPQAPNIQVHYSSYGGYVQDDYKVTPNLTLNLGVRYEFFSPTSDAHNIISNYVLPTGYTPAGVGSAGSIQVAGQNGAGSKLYNDDENNFAPRVGLAWQPYGNAKTVVHASYGIFYNAPAIGNGVNLSMGINPPFRLVQNFTSTTAAQIQLDGTTGTNFVPFPGATANGSQAAPYTSVSPTGIDRNFRTLYMNEFGMDIQQQLTRTLAITVGFLGNEGVKIPRLIEPNQGVFTGTTTSAAGAISAASYRPLTNLPPAAGTVGAGAAVAPLGPVANPLGFGGTTNPLYYTLGNVAMYISEGHSSYNALTLKAQQNYSNGLSLILAYTWSHAIDNAPGYASTSQASSGTPQNSFNLRAEKGTSDFNVGQRLVVSPVYELPFGSGKKYLTHGLAGAIIGGWQLSGIFSYDTGRPFTISMSTNRSGSVYGVDRPNQIGNPNTGPRTVNQWFNTAAFTANTFGQFGTERRNAILGPGYDDTDVAVQRAFSLSERFKFAFRAESFNVLNKVNFYNPLGTSTGQFIPAGNTNTVNNSAFGKLTQANDPRSMQFSVKLLF